MTPAIVFWFTLLLLITGFFVDNQYYNCQKYNYSSKLNGGIKTFDGKKYTIGICGSGINNSHFLGDSMEAVELTVTDEQGALLAKRHYKVFWDGRPGHEPLTTGPHSIIYQDDDKQEDHSIAMPPSLLDRVRARLF
ncbi:hypothetical protein C0Z18_19765 [Trinickia dabaoshanensis]|uniref:Uncharacterized protein n=2 Tax=Trinickia dabaoshanensis TaxID=564714 RepID=A0A2N7VKR8_9BURK|nr:hypothetical protein C0Z18_19765 [Trinickia dabaoshanensis]